MDLSQSERMLLLQAAWAFRDMDGFKDSFAMQKKSELAWREKLGNVATENSMGSTSFGSYFISANIVNFLYV